MKSYLKISSVILCILLVSTILYSTANPRQIALMQKISAPQLQNIATASPFRFTYQFGQNELQVINVRELGHWHLGLDLNLGKYLGSLAVGDLIEEYLLAYLAGADLGDYGLKSNLSSFSKSELAAKISSFKTDLHTSTQTLENNAIRIELENPQIKLSFQIPLSLEALYGRQDKKDLEEGLLRQLHKPNPFMPEVVYPSLDELFPFQDSLYVWERAGFDNLFSASLFLILNDGNLSFVNSPKYPLETLYNYLLLPQAFNRELLINLKYNMYCSKGDERKFPGVDARGSHVEMIHINLTNLLALLDQCKCEARTGLLELIKREVMLIAPSEPITPNIVPIELKHGAKSVKATIEDGTFWFLLSDVTLLLGYSNPRNLLAGIGDKLVKRNILGITKGGSAKELLHVNSSSFKALIEKSMYAPKPELLEWLDQKISFLATEEPSGRTGEPNAPKPVKIAPLTKTSESSSAPSSKRKLRMKYKGYAIKVEDYAVLSGKSISTIYKWLKEGKLENIEIDQVKYYKINYRDYNYDRIKSLLGTNDNNPKVVAELTLEIISSTES